VTVVIAARPDQAEVKAAEAALRFDYPPDKLEIILARGRQPSVQRNTAIKAARGELIYFLDDDSVASAVNLRRAVPVFADAQVQMLGGPNLCPSDAPALEQVFALVLGSWLAFGPSRARYAKVGEPRPSSEKELILCNLMARKSSLLELGGFDESLYPNEENALMDGLQQRGGKLIYDPDFVVHRRPRRTLKSFAKMLMTYGRGRAEQFRQLPTFGSALNFLPPLLIVYLLTLPAVWALTFVPAAEWKRDAYHLPLLAYLLAVLGQTVTLIPQGGFLRVLKAAPLMVLSHVCYGLGFWRGLFTHLRTDAAERASEVRLETLAR
jgi:glycosyltransferase involved in cell wall biosynthesis